MIQLLPWKSKKGAAFFERQRLLQFYFVMGYSI